MGGRQIRPARVYQAITAEMNNAVLPNHKVSPPPWYEVMSATPPAETLVRNITPRHRAPNPRATKPRKLFRPQALIYKEDRLRNTFYRDHPWELARPRIVMETDGKDYQLCDWSRGLRQPGVPLTGECVVQRQLWLMENEQMGTWKAYDQVRREFYRLRQEEEIERRVAVEEARHVGAYFGLTRNDVGLLLEDDEFEKWKVWAGKESAQVAAREKSQVDTFDEDDPSNGPPSLEDEPEPGPEPVASQAEPAGAPAATPLI